MAELSSPQSAAAQSAQTAGSGAPKGFGIVYSIILDETHEYIKHVGDKDLEFFGETSYIGAVQYRLVGQPSSDDASLPVAFPFDKNFKTLPLINESVEIFQNGGTSYYKRIGQEKTPNVDAKKTIISETFPPTQIPEDKNTSYKTTAETNTPKTNVKESSKYDKYGNYFEGEAGIHKLKLYEGDSLIETRFGQSIRFSGYNNSQKIFSPTTIIRNSSVVSHKNDALY